MHGRVTRVEMAALLAVAQDHALGQPPGAQLSAAVLARHLAAAAGASSVELATTWWTSTLRFLGCTGHAFDMAVVFGDEIEMRARAARADFANPFDVLRVMLTYAGSNQTGVARMRTVLAVLAGGKKAAQANFRSACEVATIFAKRLDVDPSVLDALPYSFERWNGRGLPTGAKATAIPRPMRVAQLAQDLEILARIEGIDRALNVIRSHRGGAYDPDLTDVVLARGADWYQAVEGSDPWDAALAVAPASGPMDDDATLEALLVLADFADLKSPWRADHSRAVAVLCRQACGPTAEAAALVHDLGYVAIPNTIWDKAGPLTRDERDRAQSHTLVTDQLLRRTPFTARLATIASAAHERMDGSGYHRRAGAADLDDAQRVLAAADCYQAMVSERPYRGALASAEASAQLRAMSASGQLDGQAVERVLEAAGHRRAARPPNPAGLTPREVEVLRLLALGLTTRQVAERLTITSKTADHHIQHIYTKLGVSTRGAAALFAIEHGLLTAAT